MSNFTYAIFGGGFSMFYLLVLGAEHWRHLQSVGTEGLTRSMDSEHSALYTSSWEAW